MNERVYDRLANILMAVAVCSALLFDAGKFSHVVVGAVGGVAAAASVALYFMNQRRPSPKEEQRPHEQPSEHMTKFIVDNTTVATEDRTINPGDLWAVVIGEQIQKYALHTYPHEVTHSYALYRAHRSPKHMAFCWHVGESGAQGFLQPEVPFSPNDVAACAIEIIRSLSVGDGHDRWEFSFGPTGLRVSAKKGHEQPIAIPQEDLDFGQISTMIQ